MKKLSFLFLALWVGVFHLVAATNIVPLPGLITPRTIIVDNDEIFITEDLTVTIFSAKDFKLKKKFGKEGEGPGEFLPSWGGIRIEVQPDKLLVASHVRASVFTRDGEFKNDYKKPPLILSNRWIRCMGENFVASSLKPDKNPDIEIIAYNIYDKNFKLIKELYSDQDSFYSRGRKMNPIFDTMTGAPFYISGNKIFIAHYGTNEKGIIHVFDTSGNKLPAIEPKYEKVEFTSDHEKEWVAHFNSTTRLKQYYNQMKNQWEYPSYFPLRQCFQVAGQEIYVQTYKASKDNKQKQFLILDLNGKFEREIYLPLEKRSVFTPFEYYITKGKIYQIVENEEEEWELHITEIPASK